jgi:hypothetical protein
VLVDGCVNEFMMFEGYLRVRTSIDALGTSSKPRWSTPLLYDIDRVQRVPVPHDFNFRMSTFVIKWYIKIGGKKFDESSSNTC